MTHANAIRFLQYEAARCRERDDGEALCLLLPALCRIFDLEPMEEVEAAAFKHEFREILLSLPFQDAADREAQAHPAAVTLRQVPPQKQPSSPAYSTA